MVSVVSFDEYLISCIELHRTVELVSAVRVVVVAHPVRVASISIALSVARVVGEPDRFIGLLQGFQDDLGSHAIVALLLGEVARHRRHHGQERAEERKPRCHGAGVLFGTR